MTTDYSPEKGDASGPKVPKFFKIISNPEYTNFVTWKDWWRVDVMYSAINVDFKNIMHMISVFLVISKVGLQRLPTEFTRRYGHNLADCISLKVPSGLEWKVELIHLDRETWICRGWQQFEEYYSICFGHFLLFKYVGNSRFEVHIFDTTATEIEYVHYDSLGRDNGMSQVAEAEGIESDSDDAVVFLKEIFTGKDVESKDQDFDDDTSSNVSVKVIDNHRHSRWEKRRMQESAGLHPVMLRKSSRTQQNCSSPDYLYDIGECSEGKESKNSDRKQVRQQERDANNRFKAYIRALAFMSEKPTPNPFSIVVMYPSYVNVQHPSLCVPSAFAREVLPGKENRLILHVSEGKRWVVRYVYGRKRASLTSGWRKFVEGNDLKVGDACVFEVVERINLTWNVIIFRG